MSKYILEDDFEDECALFAISCHAKDFKLTWAINNALNISLIKDKDVVLHTKKKGNVLFSNYTFLDKESGVEYKLVGNKTGSTMLVKEQKAADFWLIVYDPPEGIKSGVLEKLRGINTILMSFEVDANSLASRSNLIF